MLKPGPDDKVYPVIKLAAVIEALADEGVSMEEALAGVRISRQAMSSPATRVSVNQVIECYRNAARLSRDPFFAYRVGERFHLSAYGMYGFAILSSMNYRQTMQFATRYHQLATPLTEMSFTEEDGSGIWTITPMPHSHMDAVLYRFLVEAQFGIFVSLHRDVMGPAFVPREFHVTYDLPGNAAAYRDVFGCPVLSGKDKNRMLYDPAWLDGTPKLGNEITYSTVLALCDGLMDDLELRVGVAGRVRQVLLNSLMRPKPFADIASDLNMSERTLRRKLREESTSFRGLLDQLRMEMSIKYLRDTDLSVESISETVGFSDAANFRHAFRRWTKAAPHAFRDIAGRTDVLAPAG